jgi:putative transcriptional regulator
MSPQTQSPAGHRPESPAVSAYLDGQLLVAMPGIEDPRFERAVIFVCSHDERHAMGLTINRPVDGLTIEALLRKLGVDPGAAPATPVLLGGPVEPERGFVLHTDEVGQSAASQQVTGGLALSATREILEGLAGRRPAPRRAVLAIGYAGWDGGQLEQEIRNNVWLTCEPDEGLLFDDDHEHKWSRALAKMGVSADRLSAQPGRA